MGESLQKYTFFSSLKKFTAKLLVLFISPVILYYAIHLAVLDIKKSWKTWVYRKMYSIIWALLVSYMDPVVIH